MWPSVISPTWKHDKIKTLFLKQQNKNSLDTPSPSRPSSPLSTPLGSRTAYKWGGCCLHFPSPFPLVPSLIRHLSPKLYETSFIKVTSDVTLPHPMVNSQSASYLSLTSDRWSRSSSCYTFFIEGKHIMVFLLFPAVLLLHLLCCILLIFPTSDWVVPEFSHWNRSLF